MCDTGTGWREDSLMLLPGHQGLWRQIHRTDWGCGGLVGSLALRHPRWVLNQAARVVVRKVGLISNQLGVLASREHLGVCTHELYRPSDLRWAHHLSPKGSIPGMME